MTKKCNKCNKIKNLSKFYRRYDRVSSYRYICKSCDNKKSLKRRKASGWKNEKKRQGPGSKHSKQSKKNSQRHRNELTDMYIRSLITKKSKVLESKDLSDEFVEIYRLNLKLKRVLDLTPKLKGEED